MRGTGSQVGCKPAALAHGWFDSSRTDRARIANLSGLYCRLPHNQSHCERLNVVDINQSRSYVHLVVAISGREGEWDMGMDTIDIQGVTYTMTDEGGYASDAMSSEHAASVAAELEAAGYEVTVAVNSDTRERFVHVTPKEVV